MTRDKTTPPTGRIPPQTLACPRRRPSPPHRLPGPAGADPGADPLGQSGDVWRFSGRESDGTVVSFFMVSPHRRDHFRGSCPSHRHRAQRRRRQLTGFLPILTNFFLIFSILCCQCLIHVVYWFHHHGACHSVGAQDGDFPPLCDLKIRREHRYELFRAKHPQRLPSGPQRQRQDRPGREPAVHDRCPQAHGYQR